ncbi:MAG: hypothetical protein GY841_08750 [FCB group bacterium]|nr:hypothetical protein [FCB group bacterium]
MKRLTVILFILTVIMAFGAVPVTAQIVDSNIRVSLSFDDTPIDVVLKMLAAQNNLNLVVSADVEGDISIQLEEVSLPAALDAILLPNGFNYYISEGIIIVKTVERKVLGELIPKTYRLRYLDAAAVVEVIKPLLSTNGTVMPLMAAMAGSSESGQPAGTEIVLFDLPETHEVVVKLLNDIDHKRRQISIEVKIIETNLNKDEKLGINWPKSISASIGGVSTPTSGSSTSDDESDQGSNAAVMPLEDGDWQLGYLSVGQVDIVMDFLDQRNSSKLLSNPRLTTLENEKATIEVQTVIPIQTINRFSEGAVIQDIVTFQDEEVGISLEVTPRINDDSTITIRVKPVVQEIIGYSGPADSQKPITSERTITTTVAVANQQTIALGGLLKETSFETESKIFLLGSIPILGPLFTHTSNETKTTDLLILITPRIID